MGLRNNHVHFLGQHSVPHKNSEKEKESGKVLFMPVICSLLYAKIQVQIASTKHQLKIKFVIMKIKDSYNLKQLPDFVRCCVLT